MTPSPVEIEAFNNTARPRTVTIRVTPYDEDDPVVDERTIRVPGMPRGLRNGSVAGTVSTDQLPNHRVVLLDSSGYDSLTCTVDVPLEDGTESRSASVPITVTQEPDEAMTVVSLEPEGNGREANGTDGESVDIDRGGCGDTDPMGPPPNASDGKPGTDRSKRPARAGPNENPGDGGVVLELERLVYCDTMA